MTIARFSFLFSLTLGCLELNYGWGGSAGDGSGGVGAGAGAATGGSAGMPTSGGGGSGGSGGAPCVPTEETCNGLDDDCDGVADEPDSGSGEACGCTWLTWSDRLYAACTTVGDFDQLTCPAGTDLVVLGSAEEQAALYVLVPDLGTAAFIGLRQDDDAAQTAVGWRWVGRENGALVKRDGPLPPWSSDQPNDRAPQVENEPVALEDGRENCGFLFRTPSGEETMTDGACSGPGVTRVLCEQQPDNCSSGVACHGVLGCPGVLDCTMPEGERCVPSPSEELCNGFDDNCDGVLDDPVCGCVTFTDDSTGRAYKRCLASVVIEAAACGPGFRLAAPGSESELMFLEESEAGFEGHHVGIVQRLGSMASEDGWALLDGTPIPATFWSDSEPNEGGLGKESDLQNCARLTALGLRDGECGSQQNGYFCEQIP